jgi:hypothetical protein
VAALTSRELVVATDPTPGSKEAQYGVDLVAVPRTRVRSVGGTRDLVEVRLAATAPAALWLRVDAELADQVRFVMGQAFDSPGG